MSKNILIELLPDTLFHMENQLKRDYERWGETWRKRPLEGQDQRIAARLQDYIDQFHMAGVPLPYEKIACLAHIALVRMNRHDLLFSVNPTDSTEVV